MKYVDLNCDLGESFGRYTLGLDEVVIPMISSANIACGYHAGDPLVMDQTVKMAAEHGVSIGAHTGFPDLMGFGRRNMVVTAAEAKAYTQYQLGALMAFAAKYGVKVAHVKPHGAMYNMAAKDYALSKAICEAIYEIDPSIKLLGLAGSEMIRAAKDTGLPYAQEVFADRAYEDDGTLVARSKPGAMITDEELAIDRVVDMVLHGRVISINGREVPLAADSICVHGDGEKAVEFVRKIRRALEEEGIEIRSF